MNRSPIAGIIRDIRYQRGKFLNAMAANSAEENEQNIVTVEGDGHTVIFKQIAGLIARRIIFTRKVGDRVARGERIGLIKFGSRVDVLLDASARSRSKSETAFKVARPSWRLLRRCAEELRKPCLPVQREAH